MEDYFYTCHARNSKIYVFWNNRWLNVLICIKNLYYWMGLNECNVLLNIDGEPSQTMQEAIEKVMDGYDVYQLDTLEELAEFIKSEEN